MRETYKQIPGDMCDFHDYYRRIAERLPSPCRVIEVGCADGHSAIFMAETLEAMGKDFQLVLVENMDYGRDEQQNTLLTNIVRSGLAHKIRLIAMDSLKASCKFPDHWAHFIFIDASHKYEETKADIRLWYRKVMHGYFLAGHDYNAPEVRHAVDEVLRIDSMLEFTTVESSRDLGIWQFKRDDICL